MLAWEFAQLPLYSLWYQETWGRIIFAVIHCAGGDLLIAGSALLLAILFFAETSWPETSFARVAIAASLGGLAYTVFSEWLNTEIRGSWAYAIAMPTLPLIGTGLSPLMQWAIVPPLALWWARWVTLLPRRNQIRG